MTENFKCDIWIPILNPSTFRIIFSQTKGSREDFGSKTFSGYSPLLGVPGWSNGENPDFRPKTGFGRNFNNPKMYILEAGWPKSFRPGQTSFERISKKIFMFIGLVELTMQSKVCFFVPPKKSIFSSFETVLLE